MQRTITDMSRSLRVLTTWALGPLSVIACSGQVDSPGGPAPDDNSAVAGGPAGSGGGTMSPGGGAGGTATGGASGGGASGGAGGAIPTTPEPGVAMVRRLTHGEYANSVADLFEGMTFDGLTSRFEEQGAVDGFTNNAHGLTVSPTQAGEYLKAAERVSELVAADPAALLECDVAAQGEDACVSAFIKDFGLRAWRRPLSTEEEQRLNGTFASVRGELGLDESLQVLVQIFLQSPQFLYLLEPSPSGAAPGSIVPLDAWQVASRLSYFLTGSAPDETLRNEAAAGGLMTPESVAAQARRLLETKRARDRVGEFFIEWLVMRNHDRLEKDITLYPDFDLTLGPMMQEQVRLFAQTIVLDEGGTGKDLLTAPFTFVNAELAPFYDVAPPTEPGFHRVDLDPNRRAGVLTQVGFLAGQAKADQTDPVHRGKFIRESILCSPVPPPPAGAMVKAPEIEPGVSTRKRFAQHQEDPFCAGCHVLMDPIGLGFEHYDALGQWRDIDAGEMVDATGNILGTDIEGDFDGAIELSQKAAQSAQAMACMAKTWFKYGLGRTPTVVDTASLDALASEFAARDYKVSELLVALAESRSFRYQLVLDPNVSALPANASAAEEMK